MYNNRYNNSIRNAIPPVTLNLIIINCLGLMATTFFPVIKFWLGLYPFQAAEFELYQTISYMFLHGDMSHLFFNMFALYMFGSQLEYDLGQQRYIIYYMACGVGAAIIQLIIGLYYPFYITVGASGAVYGLLLSYGVLHPNSRMLLLFPPITVKARTLVIGYALLELFLGWRNNPMDNVAHFAHLGGMLWGYLLLRYWKAKRKIFF